MLKKTLIFALLATTGFVASAQTTVAPKTAPAVAPTAAPAAPAAATAKAADGEPAVKKSKTDICHDKASSSYQQTTSFTAFKSMDECVKSGGRPPKTGK
jgi:cytochrome c5